MTYMTLTIEQCATLACLLDVTAPKPGNVHRGADFVDTTFLDFVASAVAIAPAMRDARMSRLGETVLTAMQATRRVTASNTNLGIILLLAPLAAIPREQDLTLGIPKVLTQLNSEDAQDIYEAIRLANPGGLGAADRFDVRQSAPSDVLEAMRVSADRDLVARQYVSDFNIVLDEVAPHLEQQCKRWGVIEGIIDTFVFLLSRYPDSLIARKCGLETAQAASSLAARVLNTSTPDCQEYQDLLAEMDFWLRCDGNRRNPGTSADLITAGLFVVLRDEKIVLS